MKIKSFLCLSRSRKLRFFLDFILCGVARAAINMCKYQRLTFYFGHPYPMKIASTVLSKEQYQLAWEIKKSIELAARYTPWDSSCLTQAMVAKFWCQYYGIPYFFFIGVAKKSTKPFGHDSHAWVTSGPIAITGGHSMDTHFIIYCFSNLTLSD